MKKQGTDVLLPDSPVPPEHNPSQSVSKKDQIISLHTSGVDNLEDIALMTNTRTSYVASVLQAAGLISGYFDLYTTTSHAMNTYSRFFAGKLSFKTEEAASRSVDLLNRLYRQFEIARDRAGQHHALMMALTMFDRARWTGKSQEAEIYRRWLSTRLNEPVPKAAPESDARPTEPDDMPDSLFAITHPEAPPADPPSSPAAQE
ncbi:MAG TPA: hypothetical protein PLD20_05985 [Blastocatellia bacterium]|nr:hypothetical protein [Blastocatellia bacterium]HMV84299.1 hypothetical protein [Blastocatellia bacterium]HMY76112.1 hypothetical protein [Blastocatellia bacterium]HMZ17457.1 hypothetical protein [Blastocatellia bacterium]HNG28759.1 hypothetical protein [Blastocatellia bacterium]